MKKFLLGLALVSNIGFAAMPSSPFCFSTPLDSAEIDTKMHLNGETLKLPADVNLTYGKTIYFELESNLIKQKHYFELKLILISEGLWSQDGLLQLSYTGTDNVLISFSGRDSEEMNFVYSKASYPGTYIFLYVNKGHCKK